MSHTPDIDEVGCAQFESTLGLMDGLLTGAAKDAAEKHTATCAVCGPLVADWAPVHTALVNHFEERAELAKPSLASMPDRVFTALEGGKAPAREKTGLFARLAALLHISRGQLGFVTAAAALAVVVIPLARTNVSGPVASPTPSPTTTTAATNEDSGDFTVHELAFDGASGTVYTAGDDMPVIWVSESDGA